MLMYNHLTREQRYVIYLELQRGTTQEVIAQLIGVNKSTVCREIKRNSTKNGKYVWIKAHDKSEERKKRTPGNRRVSAVVRWLANRTTYKGRTVVSSTDIGSSR